MKYSQKAVGCPPLRYESRTPGRRVFASMVLLCLIIVFIGACTDKSYVKKRAERYYKQGQIYSASGKFDDAYDKFERSLDFARLAEYEEGVAYNLNEMAIIHTKRKEYAKARELLDQAIQIYIKKKSFFELSNCLTNKAFTYVQEGNAKMALKVYDDLYYWSKQAGTSMGMASALAFKGNVYENMLRDNKKAYKAYSESLELVIKANEPDFIQYLKDNINRVKPATVNQPSS